MYSSLFLSKTRDTRLEEGKFISKEPLQHSPTEHISQQYQQVILVRISNCQAMNTHTAFIKLEVAVPGATEALASCRVRGPCSLHSQGKVLPSLVSAVSVWPSVLLPLSEAAEYLSDTSTCQQAPDTSSTDAADPFFQPERSARTFSPSLIL